LAARRVDADEAARIGLVSRVCESDAVLHDAREYARTLATGSSPRSMAVMRRQVWADLSRGYTAANDEWLRVMQQLNRPDNPDFAEGVAALVEKRAPNFEPLPLDLELPELPPFAPQ
jgi:enoyl-CoA hydratase/carnithine racemase